MLSLCHFFNFLLAALPLLREALLLLLLTQQPLLLMWPSTVSLLSGLLVGLSHLISILGILSVGSSAANVASSVASAAAGRKHGSQKQEE